MKGRLVILDPEAPGGKRRVNYGLVIQGRKVPSTAARKLVKTLVAEQQEEAAYWDRIRRIVDEAPPLNERQRATIRLAFASTD
ncbi:hypothetical protein ACFU9Y_04150 [Streptomyces sp. NPDC057621]|uniref:hypothetical protein n=1 Tax=Streptomyces sp. NPDC057621 TaxID=3346186 RepID=UPI0036C88968